VGVETRSGEGVRDDMKLNDLGRLLTLVFFMGSFLMPGSYNIWAQPSLERGAEITEVSATPASFNPTKGETVVLSYRLPREGQVTLKVFDPDQGLIKTLTSEENQKEGIHQRSWDGKDNQGNIVPDQAYFFTIEARDGAGNLMVYDPTTVSGGEEIDITDVDVNREANTVSFKLPKPSWVLGRVGVHGGPLLKTLMDWEPRLMGSNIAHWNGKDESNIVNVETLKGYSMMITTMAFPENSIIAVGNSTLFYADYKRALAKGGEQKVQRPEGTRKELVRISRHYKLSRAEDRAPRFKVAFLNVSETNNEEVPILRGKVPIRVTLDDEQKGFMIGQRFEIAFYLDYQLFAEEEEGYTPFKWTWNTEGISKGEHILTINVISLGDQVGTASLKFIKEGD
jgi:hypothetical protein